MLSISTAALAQMTEDENGTDQMKSTNLSKNRRRRRQPLLRPYSAPWWAERGGAAVVLTLDVTDITQLGVAEEKRSILHRI